MAKYLVLIYGDEQKWDALTAEEVQDYMGAHGEFAAAAGAGLLGGNELESTSAATSLRNDANGRLMVTDGPFVETKEVLGGYYLLEAADLDEAIKLASRLPEVQTRHGGVEIRPVRVRD
ncbi:Uncharacterized conserved protein [Actinopolymorpha cephalotaxi]|uniref:Uncharacterized conserved protein n=1 Tax=Actinopolymorpha cephalotaxi TaxID=504797 RepID=A0A1I3AQE7_9ACTN|nr:YciI family protein [Actinopolymorpha cephalotaxi]NYH86013.1 hypothetical protein [Actinopolymorpha cephalotaxi]SFH52297.1 Uncharacterized conserved protein [Actinopolymorpha cephalotaxi]